MSVIEVKNLTRDYKIKKRGKSFVSYVFSNKTEIKNALNDISFQIDKGEVVGYVGANGSGKSTTIKILTGILVPTSGDVRVLGKAPYQHRKEIAFKIGAVFGQRTQLWWDLPVIDSFELLQKIYRVPKNLYDERLSKFIDALNMEEFINSPVRQLSLGQRMKSDLVASLLHDPEILFLDEPTIGLDVLSKDQLRRFIREMHNRGVTIILTTHDMKDIEETCERLLLIDKGKLLLDSTISTIKNQYAKTRKLLVQFEQAIDKSVLEQLNLPIQNLEIINEKKYELTFLRDKISANSLTNSLSNHFLINDISVIESDIEGIVRNIYSKGINHAEEDSLPESMTATQ